MQLSKDVWFIQYHLRGSRVCEALSLEKFNIKDSNLLVAQSKSSGKKFKLIQITEKIQVILDRYNPKSKSYITIEDFKEQMKQSWDHSKSLQMAGNDSPYIFPLLENYPTSPYEIQLKYRIINSHLQAITEIADVNKKITRHIARHSFAKGAKELIDIPSIKLLLRHS